ncbi:MAG: triose-phosphate isomerase [Candidatus Colwellbacteria bacterium]|nr:triose-phosphate isomerase [Candidatus Colwellbacteria bacterium]
MKKLLVANWKTNPLTTKEAVKLAKAEDHKGVVIAPPHVFLESASKTLKKAKLASQDAFWGDLGAYTGEISWRQLKEFGVEYVILGHSERRNPPVGGGETDELINKKLLSALEGGLNIILCVGEPKEIREKGIETAKNYVQNQLEKDLKGAENLKLKTENLIIAYEPIWAIGTGTPDTPESAAEMSIFIKSLLTTNYSLQTKVLYGGSVNGRNSSGFLSHPEIDGALVGGASLNPEEFNKLI